MVLVLGLGVAVVVAIVGVALLALDGARYMSLQTQLQNGADALALAGAAELDRLPDAEKRAVDAITHLITNPTVFGSERDRNVEVANITFYSQIPPNDSAPLSTGVIANGPIDARFVAVTVRPVTLGMIFPVAIFGGASATAGASATRTRFSMRMP